MKITKEKKSETIQTFKVIVIGNSGVGKSSLVYRYCEKKFEQHYLPTIGKIQYCFLI